MPEDAPLAFVLMPFEAEFDDVFSELIKVPLEAAGFEVRRADSLLNQRSVLQDVVRGIHEAALIVADVSGLNANVLYELGLAHAMGKRTVMLTRSIDELPFDLRPYRANQYSTRFNEAGQIASTLKEVGEAVIAGSAQFSNPVQDFAPGALAERSQVTLPASRPREPGGAAAAEGEDEPSAEDSDGGPELGLFDYAEKLSESSERTTRASTEIGQAIEQVGIRVRAHSERLERAHKNLGEKAAGVLVGIMRDAAKDINDFCDRMEPLNEELRNGVTGVAAAATGLAQSRIVSDEADRQSLRDDIQSISEAETVMVETYFSVSNFAQEMADLPNMERNLTRASRRGARVVGATAEIVEVAQAEFARARHLMEERLAAAGDGRP